MNQQPTNEYVIDDRAACLFRVDRATMTDPDVLAAERARIFDRVWLYVGHTTEVPRPHDFRSRDLAGRPVILTRDATGTIRVLLNACPHRGALVCREKAGNGKYLRCFYHGWNFDTSGRLVSVPGEEGYGPGFDKTERSLGALPRVETYRGFVFAAFNPDVEGLESWLAGAREYLDLVADQSEAEMAVLRGTHEYSLKANWKLMVENSVDGYHLLHVHQRYLKMSRNAGREFAAGPVTTHAVDLGNGHMAVQGFSTEGLAVGRPLATQSARDAWARRRARFGELYGQGWTDRMYGTRNLVVFPNLAVIDLVGAVLIRKIDPIAADRTAIEGWELAPSDENAELRANRLDNFLTFWGPGGLGTPDDVEALECCQRGLDTVREQRWSDISRGMSQVEISTMEEAQMRVWWRRWNEFMTGQVLPPEPHPVPDVFTARRPTGPAVAAR